jgi:hypothetical protein
MVLMCNTEAKMRKKTMETHPQVASVADHPLLRQVCVAAGVAEQKRFFAADLCRILDCTPRTLWRLSERGELRLFKIGRQAWALAGDVEQYLLKTAD